MGELEEKHQGCFSSAHRFLVRSRENDELARLPVGEHDTRSQTCLGERRARRIQTAVGGGGGGQRGSVCPGAVETSVGVREENKAGK